MIDFQVGVKGTVVQKVVPGTVVNVKVVASMYHSPCLLRTSAIQTPLLITMDMLLPVLVFQRSKCDSEHAICLTTCKG
jgi:hypothetical protein